MSKFNFEIDGNQFSLDEQNYKSQFEEIVEVLRLINRSKWSSNHDLHSLLMERSGSFSQAFYAAIFKKYRDSTDCVLLSDVISKLLTIHNEVYGDPHIQNISRNDVHPYILNYSTVEKFSLTVELCANEFQETLADKELDQAFIEIISYLKKGDLDYEFSESKNIAKLDQSLKWIKNYNQKTRQRHEFNNRLSHIEQALFEFKKREAESNVTQELESAWTIKRRSHIIILVLLCIAILSVFSIGYMILRSWMLNNNPSFGNCCENMGFIDLIYGGVIYWGIQYKAITIFVWFTTISLFIQLAKSQWHLINDASERIAIIKTYKLFTKNKQLGEPGKYMDALLQSIYRSSDDGLLKDVRNIYASVLPGISRESGDEK